MLTIKKIFSHIMIIMLSFTSFGMMSTSYCAEKNVSNNHVSVTYNEYSSIQVGMKKPDVEALVGGIGNTTSNGASYIGDNNDPHMIKTVEVTYKNDIVTQKDIWYALRYDKKSGRYYYEGNAKSNIDRSKQFISPTYAHESSNENDQSGLITKLFVSSIQELDISKVVNLKELYCDYNGLTRLDISNNRLLTILYCNGNNLRSLDTSQNTALTKVDCSWNSLIELNLSKNKELKELKCFWNKLINLDLSENSKITRLECQRNKLKSLNVKKCPKLRSLWCSDNKLSNLTLTNNKELRELYCAENKLKNLNLNNCKKLQYLQCKRNNIQTLNIKNCVELKELICARNKITKLDVSKLKKIRELKCFNNKIKRHYFGKNSKLINLVCERKLPKAKLPKKLKGIKPTRYLGGWQYTTLYR